MARLSFSSLRVRLILLVLLGAIPAFGLLLYLSLEYKHIAAAHATHNVAAIARDTASAHRQLARAARRLLIQLSQQPEVEQPETAACSSFLADQLEQYSEYANLGVITLDGNLACSAVPLKSPINAADRTYFQRTVKSRDFSIGEYQIGRVTGKATVNFGYPLFDAKGVFRGVVFAAMDLHWINDLLAQWKLSPGSVLTVIDPNGVVLGRFPDPKAWLGKQYPNASGIKAAVAKHGEAILEVPGLDRVRRIYAFTPLDISKYVGAYVGIGIPTATVYSEVNRSIFRSVILLGLATVLALIAAWVGGDLFVLRQINALINSAKRLGRGDLSVRTGIPHDTQEIGQLASSFDEMAEALQKRQARAERAEKQIKRQLEELAALREIELAITSNLDLRAVLNVLMEKIDAFLPYTAVLVWLLNRETGMVERAACWNLDEKDWKGRNLEGTPSLVKEAIEGQIPVVVNNVQTDPRTLDRDFYRSTGLMSYLGVPLIVKGDVLGDLVFLTREEHRFSKDEIDFLTTLAGHAAMAIHNSQLYEQTKKQAIELEKANKVKSEFLSVMSHELRTPLHAITGYADLLKDRAFGEVTSRQEKVLTTILSRSSDLLEMINNLLLTTSLEAERAEVQVGEVSLVDFLADLKSRYDLPIGKDVMLVWKCPSDVPTIRTDPGKLGQVLQNLVNNALKFTPRGSVTISAGRVPNLDAVQFKVADTGVGISPEALPIIFDMFRQADSSESRLYGGAGLGLYIVKKFTELLGGTVEVESELGQGSTFTLTFPWRCR